MEKKLPKVFANPFLKKVQNNKRIFSSEKEKYINDIPKKETIENINVKINRIFKSTKYIYKIDTEITTEEGVNNYRLIGKNKDNLITIDNKLIPISKILDIKEVNFDKS